MTGRREFPAVPLGALGFVSSEPVPARPPRSAVTRGRNGRWESILGGVDAEREVRRVLRRALKEARRRLRQVEEGERRDAYWGRIQAQADEAFKEALSLSVPPVEGETEDGYDLRLATLASAARPRSEGETRLSLTLAPARVRNASNAFTVTQERCTRYSDTEERASNASTVTQERKNVSNASTVTQERKNRARGKVPRLPPSPAHKASGWEWRAYAHQLEVLLGASSG